MNSPPGSSANLRQSADITMLLVRDSNFCGVALSNAPSHGIGMAQKDCAVGYYTFGHETSHMFGATHNAEAGTGTPFYPYGRGYLIKGTGSRTIMS